MQGNGFSGDPHHHAPQGYRAIEGSERRPRPSAKKVGPADPDEVFKVLVVLRRRSDGPPVPGHAHFLAVPPQRRQRMPNEEFAKRYGAHPDDIAQVTAFARDHDLTVLETNPTGRTVRLSGTVAAMSAAFGVELALYEDTFDRGHGHEKRTRIYRGRDGYVYLPAPLHPLVIGVFGLDNRAVGKRAGNPEPPDTTTVSVATVAQLYNYPTSSATGQTIGILSFEGFQDNDIDLYFAGIGQPRPDIDQIGIDGAVNSGAADGETTQDIQIAAAFAPGAAINVYFFDWEVSGQMHWVDALTRVAHPDPSDVPCTVLSSSDYISDGDDPSGLDFGATLAMITAVHMALEDCAIQGVTCCFASGDRGTASGLSDGEAHTSYPASDPWVLAVGGTTIGNIMGSSFDEYVWNDPQFGGWGTTGGGISRNFPVPDYQSGITLPPSISQPAFHGRGMPDVAGNANIVSGYDLILGGAASVGNGTSASTPQWAGLIAVINAALGVDVGFVNPAIYALGGSVFRDIVPGGGPADNGNSGVAGYPAGPGWDACTGWGSPNGLALLDGLRSLYTRSFYFIVDKSTFGVDEVSDVVAHAGGLYQSVFWLVLEGYSLDELGTTVPDLTGAFAGLDGVTLLPDPSNPMPENAADLYTPQRIRFAYNVLFTSEALTDDFPGAGDPPTPEILNASITIDGDTLAAEALFELASGADPYFTNIDPSPSHTYFYLSQDLRVFSATAGESPLPGAPPFTNDPYASLQSLLHFMNTSATYTTPGTDRLSSLPGQSGYETADSSVTPLDPTGHRNYNFAIARVRLQGDAGAQAENVRVFFRLFVAESCDTDFDPNTTYKRQTGSGAEAGLPVFPLPSGDGISDPSGSSLKTIPFFASDAVGTHDYDGSLADANIRTLIIPMGQDKLWAYFGCYLDVYDASNQSLFPGTHHCILAEIAYDETPLANSGGMTLTPENSDKLAQRNLQITSSGNPGYPDTHRIPQTFDTRPSPPSTGTGELLDYPDELMIDWGNVPPGSTASIYWPAVDAQAVLDLATSLYGTHKLYAADPHTLTCKTTAGVAYIPIPRANPTSFAGLFTIDLPTTIRRGQEFTVEVRRVTSRRPRAATQPVLEIDGFDFARGDARKRTLLRNWRYVTGTFQVKIPVGDDETLRLAEERTLSILKWRLSQYKPTYRWRPVLERLIAYVSKRVDGFGGDASAVNPSPSGLPYYPGLGGHHPRPGGGGHGEAPPSDENRLTVTGKVSAMIYDRFGDFAGFWLDTDHGEDRFDVTESPMESVVRHAWIDRILIRVVAARHAPHRPLAVEYLRLPRYHGDQ